MITNRILLYFALSLIFYGCGSFPTSEEAGLDYPTKLAMEIPENIEWEEIDKAFEIINIKEKKVYYSNGSKPISAKHWESFKVGIPWVKNLNRNLLFTSTSFLRSPSATINCQGTDCFVEKEYKGYSWVELAQPIAIDYIPDKTDSKKPEEGHLVIKIIKKCQIVKFEDEIYELSDEKGNKYVMHATKTGTPNLNTVLPEGYTLQKVKLQEPLLVVPFGDKGDCYLNIVGDHLGQGYHQYKYAKDSYPNK